MSHYSQVPRYGQKEEGCADCGCAFSSKEDKEAGFCRTCLENYERNEEMGEEDDLEMEASVHEDGHGCCSDCGEATTTLPRGGRICINANCEGFYLRNDLIVCLDSDKGPGKYTWDELKEICRRRSEVRRKAQNERELQARLAALEAAERRRSDTANARLRKNVMEAEKAAKSREEDERAIERYWDAMTDDAAHGRGIRASHGDYPGQTLHDYYGGRR